MFRFLYSALTTSCAFLFFICSLSLTTASGQSGGLAQERLDEAIKAYHNTDYTSAMRQFREITGEYCTLPEDAETCFDARYYQAIIFQYESKNEELDKLLNELEDYVHTTFDGEYTKLARIYSRRVILAEKETDLEEGAHWAAKQREIVSNRELKPYTHAISHASIGSYEDFAGNYEEAIIHYEKAIELAESLDDLDKTGDLLIQVYNNLGISYRRAGDSKLAMRQYEKNLQLTRLIHGEEHVQMARSYNNIGNIHFVSQDIGEAAEYFARAAGIIEKNYGPNHSMMAATLNNAAVCYYSLENYELAAQFLERAQRVKESTLGTDHPQTAIGYSNLASIHIQNGDFDQAEINYLRSISVRENIFGDNHPDLIEPIISLGKLYSLHLNNQLTARKYFHTALSIGLDRLGENHPSVAESNLQIGNSYYNQQNFEDAQVYYKRAIELLYGEYTLNGEHNLEKPVVDPVKLTEVLQKKSRLLMEKTGTYNEENYLKALYAMEWAADIVDQLQISYKHEASKLRLIDQNYSIYTSAIEILASLYRESTNPDYIEQIFEYIEKSRSRVSRELIQNFEARSFAGVPEDIIESESTLNTEITRLQQQLFKEKENSHDQYTEAINALQDSVFTKKRELETFTAALEDAYPAYFELKYDQSVLSLNETQKLLSDDESIVGYVLGTDTTYAFVISSTTANIINLGPISEVIDYIERLRSDIITGDTNEYINTSHTLYEKLFKPVEPYLTGSSVLIMADQMLHYLPFEVFLTEKPDHNNFHKMAYLLKDYTISYIPSASLLSIMDDRRPSQSRNLLALAPFSSEIIRPDDESVDVQYASAVAPLLLTRHETQTITDLFNDKRYWSEYFRPQKTKILSGSEATLTNLSSVNLKEYNFIHFATHAFVNENSPEFSGIMMYPEDGATGIAYVGDIYNMEFNADLVVLGACETGLGTPYRGEGLIGFTRAFIYAGASNLAVSMWKVNDQPTTYLMIDFYDLIRDGYSYSEALRQAKLNIIKKPHMADPVNWAAFILTGR